MRVRFIWVGKTRDARLQSLVAEYLERLKHFVRCEIKELRAASSGSGMSGIEDESKRIIRALDSDAVTILLDIKGRELDSHQLAIEIEKFQNDGTKAVDFVIGGAEGVSSDVAKLASAVWSMSRLTFTHEMARVVLVEQLYRAYTIIHRLPYQK